MFNKEEFFKGLLHLKEEYRISIKNRSKSGETNSRRVAILITNLYLKQWNCDQEDYIDINIVVAKAGFLERGIYEAIKKEKFTCDMIENEFKMLSIEKKQRKAKTKTGLLNPLKLSIEGKDRGYDNHVFIKKIINILKENRSNGIRNLSRCKTKRFNNNKKFNRNVRGIKSNDFRLDEGQRSSIHKTR